MPTDIDGIEQVSSSGGGGGGGPVTIADGADVAEGTQADINWPGFGNGTVISILKKIASLFISGITATQGQGNNFPTLSGWEQFISDGTGSGIAKINTATPGATDAALTVRNIPSGIQPTTNTNIDVALSTRLKPADTLTKVATVDTITNPVAITAAALPLPTGAAIEAGHLATIDTKSPVLGQALAASSVPVVLTAAQITTLTPPAAITGFALEAGNLASIKAKTDNLDVLLSTRLKPADTLAGITLVGTLSTITNPVTVTPPTLTKGTQGATGFSIQDLKDAGRNTRIFMLDAITAAPAIEALA